MLPEVRHMLGTGEVFHGEIASPAGTGSVGDVHQAFELGIVIQGRVERRFDDFAVTLGPGDVWLVPGWEPHASRWTSAHKSRFLVCFLPEFLGDETFDGVSWLSLFAAPPRERPWVCSEELQSRMIRIAQELGREVQEASPGWRSAVRQGMLNLLLHLFRSWQPPQHASLRTCNTNNLARMTPALDLVRSSPARRISLSEAATACSLSVTQFRFLFRQTMGMTFGTFTLRARLSQVARLLQNSDLPVEAIAERSGFTDHSHLHRAFTRAYGRTPGAYREQHASAGGGMPAVLPADG